MYIAPCWLSMLRVTAPFSFLEANIWTASRTKRISNNQFHDFLVQGQSILFLWYNETNGVLNEVHRGQKRVRIVDVMARLQNRFASSVGIKNMLYHS